MLTRKRARSAPKAAQATQGTKTTVSRRPKRPKACSNSRQCPRGALCDPVERVCVQRGMPHASWLPAAAGPIRGPASPPRRGKRDDYPAVWAKRPGDAGFNAYVRGLLRGSAIVPRLACPDPRTGVIEDQWYQSVLQWLVHPRTPIHRLLVAWQLGTGKTIGMLRVLSNFFQHAQPKIVVFPTEALVTNFYAELLRVPNPYRDWVQTEHRFLVAQKRLTGSLTAAVAQTLLERPRAGSGLAAPMRAFRYTLAGGQGLLNSPVVRANRRLDPNHALDNTIVLCDEAHNIVKPPTGVLNAALREKVRTLGHRLYHAQNAVPPGLRRTTGGPAVDRAVHRNADRGRPRGRRVPPAHREGRRRGLRCGHQRGLRLVVHGPARGTVCGRPRPKVDGEQTWTPDYMHAPTRVATFWRF